MPAGYVFHMMPMDFTNMTNVVIRIEGTIKASKRHVMYPLDMTYSYKKGKWKDAIKDFMVFDGAENVTFRGNGTVDGQGFMWWLREFIQ